MPEVAATAPLDNRMLVMDVVDTLRHGGESHIDPPTGALPPELLEPLRELYRRQGVDIADDVMRDGVTALAENRFVYRPPRGPLAVLARLYIGRRGWGRPALAIIVLLILALAFYLLAYRPYAAREAEQSQRELQVLPARLDALYDEVFDDTKVQTAADTAGELRDQGKAAAAKGDRAGADKAMAELEALRDTLETAYSVRIVSDAATKPGFWTFPTNNTEATNYYIVVEAVDDTGKILALPIASEDTGAVSTVTRWGLRVPQSVYEAVMADKQDDGVVQHNLVGVKQDGFTTTDYTVPVLGGALTQW